MKQQQNFILHMGKPFFLIGVILCFSSLLFVTKQISAHQMRQALVIDSWEVRSNYYLIDCPEDNSHKKRLVAPLPEARYFYSDSYGWFDATHFGTGNPGKLIADVKAVVVADGGVITITQDVRDGLTGYTSRYLVSDDVKPEDVTGVALGIYMDWSVRFESWQGEAPRSLAGPFTPFSIEDLPTQYVGFFDATSNLKLTEIFVCYIGRVEDAEGPPHIQVVDEQSEETIDLPEVERLTNEGFQPMVLTETGWQFVHWPVPMRLEPIPSSPATWVFESDETWYLEQDDSE